MRCFILNLLLLLSLSLQAQELRVRSFGVSATDLSARTSPRRDPNGRLCALLKVALPLTGAKFEGFVVDDVQNHDGEYWVYMPQGKSQITVKHVSRSTSRSGTCRPCSRPLPTV